MAKLVEIADAQPELFAAARLAGPVRRSRSACCCSRASPAAASTAGSTRASASPAIWCTQAVADAHARGYLGVEGNPRDPGIGAVLAGCGFRRRPGQAADASPLREPALYRLELATP
ncbi:MAG: hypothetical protein ACYC5O_22655 [Anaerolineae bacterium]